MTNVVLRAIKTTRFRIAVMMFTASLINFVMSINMSLNIEVMTEPTFENRNITGHSNHKHIFCFNTTYDILKKHSEKNFGVKYKWDATEEALILGSYFWGYAISSLFGGRLAERFGPTKVVLIATVLFGILTILGPLFAYISWIALLLSRTIIGLFAGVIFPCLHCLIAKWAPPHEKGKFMTTLMGGPLGLVLGWPFLAAIIDALGWVWSFYFNGMIVLIWCIIWYFIVTDTPAEHPRISEEEKLYIIASLGDKVAHKHLKTWPPYKKILRSTPFWALTCLYFGNMWGLFFIMTTEPHFINSVLGIDKERIGFLACIPNTAKLIAGFGFGVTGDYLTKKKEYSRTKVRKTFVVFSHIIPGMLLYFIILIGCNIYWIMGLQTISLASNGAATITNLQNVQDLAPNYAGTISGIVGCVGTIPGIIIPFMVSSITSHDNCLHMWYIIFSIGGTVYIVSGIIFCIFGSGEVQPWNELSHQEPIQETQSS